MSEATGFDHKPRFDSARADFARTIRLQQRSYPSITGFPDSLFLGEFLLPETTAAL